MDCPPWQWLVIVWSVRFGSFASHRYLTKWDQLDFYQTYQNAQRVNKQTLFSFKLYKIMREFLAVRRFQTSDRQIIHVDLFQILFSIERIFQCRLALLPVVHIDRYQAALLEALSRHCSYHVNSSVTANVNIWPVVTFHCIWKITSHSYRPCDLLWPVTVYGWKALMCIFTPACVLILSF